jgi:hypothetical protein
VTVYRKRKVPVLYSYLPFLRAAPPCGLADCPEDLEYLRRIQSVASGKECISLIEASYQLILRADFPGDLLARDGTSGDGIEWSYWYWKAWDVEYLFKQGQPAEAIPIEEAGITRTFLETIVDQRSCIPDLEDIQVLLEQGSRKGYTLDNHTRKSIEQREAKLLAAMRIATRKGLSSGKKPIQNDTHGDPTLPIKVRERVIRRDSYRCVFCGATGEHTRLEVNHIIPRSLIRKLSLSQSLFVDEANLCTTCWSCNRSKRDTLHKEDIAVYIERFREPSHPNHGVVHFLETISTLQGFDQ